MTTTTTAAATAAASLNNLRDDILKIVFHYVGEPISLLAVSYSCKSLYKSLKNNDEMWMICPKGMYRKHIERSGHIYEGIPDKELRGNSIRESLFIDQTLIRIHQVQRQSQKYNNVLLYVLGDGTADRFRIMIDNIIRIVDVESSKKFQAFVRGDTIAFMSDLVEDYMIKYLESAIIVSIHATNSRSRSRQQQKSSSDDDEDDEFTSTSSSSYPQLEVSDLKVVDRLSYPQHGFWRIGDVTWQCGGELCDDFSSIDNLVLSNENQRKIIRLLTYKAGIVKLTGGAFNYISQIMFSLIASLIFDSIEEGVCHSVDDHCRLCTPSEDDDDIDLFNVAPPSRMMMVHNTRLNNTATTTVPVLELNDNAIIHMVIVPRQIKDAANRLNIVIPYHDPTDWIPAEGCSIEDEIKEAKEQYYSNNNNNSNSMDTIPWFINQKIDIPTCNLLMRTPRHDDSNSEYESSSSSDFSMYSDRKCKDRYDDDSIEDEDEDDSHYKIGDGSNKPPDYLHIQKPLNQQQDADMMDCSSVSSSSS